MNGYKSVFLDIKNKILLGYVHMELNIASMFFGYHP